MAVAIVSSATVWCPSNGTESERATFQTLSRDAGASNRRTIVNGQRLSLPPQLMKRTTCQSRNRPAGTAPRDVEHHGTGES
jgi:hypothetical protein